MTIEVRQLLIKSEVTEQTHGSRESSSARDLEQLKQQVLADTKAWLAEKLQQLRER